MERGFRFPNEEVAYGREAQRMPLPIGGNQISAGGAGFLFRFWSILYRLAEPAQEAQNSRLFLVLQRGRYN